MKIMKKCYKFHCQVHSKGHPLCEFRDYVTPPCETPVDGVNHVLRQLQDENRYLEGILDWTPVDKIMDDVLFESFSQSIAAGAMAAIRMQRGIECHMEFDGGYYYVVHGKDAVKKGSE